MKKINKLFILLPLIILAGSCKKFVDVGQPKNQLTSTEVFADSADASSALVGTYISIMNSPLAICSGGITLLSGLSADELYQTANNSSYTQFYVDGIQTNNSTDNGLWYFGYNYMYATNAVIEGVTSSPGISVSAKTQIIAEAKFIRAFIYFQLVNLYGGVPIVTTTNYQISGIAPRGTVDAVYDQIVSDLLYAESNLGINTGANNRPSTLVASALLAKVYLYQGKYASAQAESSKVINSGAYHLEADLNNVFLTSSGEIIWQLDMLNTNYTWEGLYFVPTSSRFRPRYVLTSSLYGSFEAGDQRLVKWVKTSAVSGSIYPYPYKYKNNSLAPALTENYTVLRLADQYLIRAEAEANQGDLIDAVTDINIIRSRSSLAGTTATDQPSLLTAIVNERRHEFFCEWGNRWFDLKRWNLATPVLSLVKTNWNINDALYPVPISQITSNPYLVQNPGY